MRLIEFVKPRNLFGSKRFESVVSVRSGICGADTEVPRQEFANLVNQVIGDLGENRAEIGLWIDAVETAGLDQRQNARSALAALI